MTHTTVPHTPAITSGETCTPEFRRSNGSLALYLGGAQFALKR